MMSADEFQKLFHEFDKRVIKQVRSQAVTCWGWASRVSGEFSLPSGPDRLGSLMTRAWTCLPAVLALGW